MGILTYPAYFSRNCDHPNSMRYRIAEIDDVDRLMRLYTAVAAAGEGIARSATEITEEYVRRFVEKSIASGLIIVGENPEQTGELIAEIHAYRPGPFTFGHVLGDMTMVVHPGHQGRKIGRTILMIFLDEIVRHRPDVGRVELMTRESNARAIGLYQSVGFRIEGRLEMRIRTPDRNYEADIPMGWQNPNFEFEF